LPALRKERQLGFQGLSVLQKAYSSRLQFL
jgi:hypothetical protein